MSDLEQLFFETCMRLIDRDGQFLDRGEDGFISYVSVGPLRIVSHNDALVATVPGTLPPPLQNMRVAVFDEENDVYSVEGMLEWLPRIKARLVLEDLADA